MQSALGRVVREAAPHVLRHGDPRLCVIRLRTAEGEVRLAVENDGASPDAAGASGLNGLTAPNSPLEGGTDG
ncbi:hypothetical protein [Streptomyces sp. NPDC057429]|uniref:hypothetical protein n=1 Tax=Streptomyces sp. NPDC057429 TaxID=3346130 RepID=UPI0036A89B6E